MDQLHMHFTSAIHNKAFNMVLGYVMLTANTGDTKNYQKRQYSDLCKVKYYKNGHTLKLYNPQK